MSGTVAQDLQPADPGSRLLFDRGGARGIELDDTGHRRVPGNALYVGGNPSGPSGARGGEPYRAVQVVKVAIRPPMQNGFLLRTSTSRKGPIASEAGRGF